MRLVSMYLKNFRAYKNRTYINFDSMTAFIGKNDAGKSTILDALNYFFNSTKIDPLDKCVFSDADEEVIIACCFSSLPESIVLDTSVNTTLQDEYLLNDQGYLEVIKTYNPAGNENVFINAFHPTTEDFDFLHLKKITDLQKLATQRNVEVEDRRIKSSLRKGLWTSLDDNIVFSSQLIPVKKIEEKILWDNISKCFPTFALFKSDRSSKDDDPEAKDPMNLAIKTAIKNNQSQFDILSEAVRMEVETTASATIEKLKDFDSNLASEIVPDFKKNPDWAKAFTFTLNGSNNIPINSRGSGTRRLILFSFFRATVENSADDNGIIYAIEEPETSQHPNYQKMIFDTLSEMVNNQNCQIILTTHVPGFAKLLPIDYLRYVFNNDNVTSIKMADDDCTLLEIVNTLGILPNIKNESQANKIKLIFCVEGPNDVEFFKNLSNVLHSEDPSIINLNENEEIILIPLGGSVLQHWVDKQYLKALDIPEFHIYDKDSDGDYQSYVNDINSRNDDSCAYLLNKRTIENYIHPTIIENLFGYRIEIHDDTDVPKVLSDLMRAHEEDNCSKSKVKNKIACEATKSMTIELLNIQDTESELINYFGEIKAKID